MICTRMPLLRVLPYAEPAILLPIARGQGWQTHSTLRQGPPCMGLLCAAGKPFWERAGVRGKIDLRVGPAADTLDELLASEGEGSVDFGCVIKMY